MANSAAKAEPTIFVIQARNESGTSIQIYRLDVERSGESAYVDVVRALRKIHARITQHDFPTNQGWYEHSILLMRRLTEVVDAN
jgi:hypothetical protein